MISCFQCMINIEGRKRKVGISNEISQSTNNLIILGKVPLFSLLGDCQINIILITELSKFKVNSNLNNWKEFNKIFLFKVTIGIVILTRVISPRLLKLICLKLPVGDIISLFCNKVGKSYRQTIASGLHCRGGSRTS